MKNRHTNIELYNYVEKSLKTDESGDANLLEFVVQKWNEVEQIQTLNDFLTSFLIWANGPRWEEFLNDPDKFDGIPPAA